MDDPFDQFPKIYARRSLVMNLYYGTELMITFREFVEKQEDGLDLGYPPVLTPDSQKEHDLLLKLEADTSLL